MISHIQFDTHGSCEGVAHNDIAILLLSATRAIKSGLVLAPSLLMRRTGMQHNRLADGQPVSIVRRKKRGCQTRTLERAKASDAPAMAKARGFPHLKSRPL